MSERSPEQRLEELEGAFRDLERGFRELLGLTKELSDIVKKKMPSVAFEDFTYDKIEELDRKFRPGR